MKSYWLTVPLALVLSSACSSSDQSLGETRAQPNPDPGPDVDPDPPDPDPVVQPCENMLLHMGRTGACRPATECPFDQLTAPGYECAGGLACCDMTVGCRQGGCGGTSNGPVLPPGGESGAAGSG